jgi:hypothetical protein
MKYLPYHSKKKTATRGRERGRQSLTVYGVRGYIYDALEYLIFFARMETPIGSLLG